MMPIDPKRIKGYGAALMKLLSEGSIVKLAGQPYRVKAIYASWDEARIAKAFEEAQHPRDNRGRFTEGSTDFSSEERQAIEQYGNSGYQINNDLRDGKKLKGVLKDMADHLDSAIAKAALSKDTTLYKGASFQVTAFKVPAFDKWSKSNYPAEKDVFTDLKVGKVLTNTGFTSTSTSQEAATKFALPFRGEPGFSNANKEPEFHSYVLKIDALKGSKALDLSDVGSFQATTLHGHEREILLPRGVALQVTKIEEVKDHKWAERISPKSTMKIIHVRMVKK